MAICKAEKVDVPARLDQKTGTTKLFKIAVPMQQPTAPLPIAQLAAQCLAKVEKMCCHTSTGNSPIRSFGVEVIAAMSAAGSIDLVNHFGFGAGISVQKYFRFETWRQCNANGVNYLRHVLCAIFCHTTLQDQQMVLHLC